MFDQLSNVPWCELLCAHGSAAHVPLAIENLSAAAKNERDAAYWKLDNYVVLQSTIYDAGLYTIPFLVEIVAAHPGDSADRAYDLLFELANGIGWDEAPRFGENGELTLRDACRRSVSEGMASYLYDVVDSTSPMRYKALDLIVVLSPLEAAVIDTLKEVERRESDAGFREYLRRARNELFGVIE